MICDSWYLRQVGFSHRIGCLAAVLLVSLWIIFGYKHCTYRTKKVPGTVLYSTFTRSTVLVQVQDQIGTVPLSGKWSFYFYPSLMSAAVIIIDCSLVIHNNFREDKKPLCDGTYKERSLRIMKILIHDVISTLNILSTSMKRKWYHGAPGMHHES